MLLLGLFAMAFAFILMSVRFEPGENKSEKNKTTGVASESIKPVERNIN